MDHVWESGLSTPTRLRHARARSSILTRDVPGVQARWLEQRAGSTSPGLTLGCVGSQEGRESARGSQPGLCLCLFTAPARPPPSPRRHTHTHCTLSDTHIYSHTLTHTLKHMHAHAFILTHTKLQVPPRSLSHPLPPGTSAVSYGLPLFCFNAESGKHVWANGGVWSKRKGGWVDEWMMDG